MTTEDDIKTIQKEVNEMKDYPLKLSWKNIWICITTGIALLGSSFGAGMKIQYEGDKIVQLKQEREYIKQLSAKDDLLIESNRRLKESNENILFLTNRYEWMKDKLQKCIDGSNIILEENTTK
jgi:hypothetical protein